MTGLEPLLGFAIAAVIADVMTNGWVRRSLADGAREGVRRSLPALSATIRRVPLRGLRGRSPGTSPQRATTATDDHPGTLRMPDAPGARRAQQAPRSLSGRPGRRGTETLHGDPTDASPESRTETSPALRRKTLRASPGTLRRTLPGLPSVALTSKKTRRTHRDWRLTINVNTPQSRDDGRPPVRPAGDPVPAGSRPRPESPPPVEATPPWDSPASPSGESPAAPTKTSPDPRPETQPQPVQEDAAMPSPFALDSEVRITESVSAHIAEGLDLATAVQDVVEQFSVGITERVSAHVASAENISGFPPSLQGEWVDQVGTPIEEAWALLQRAVEGARVLAEREEAELRPLVEAADAASSDASGLTVGTLRTE